MVYQTRPNIKEKKAVWLCETSPPEVPHHLHWLFSVLHSQEKAMWKSRPGHLLLFYHCVLIVYEYIYDMEQQNAFHLLLEHGQFSKPGHKYSNISVTTGRLITSQTQLHVECFFIWREGKHIWFNTTFFQRICKYHMRLLWLKAHCKKCHVIKCNMSLSTMTSWK